MEGAQMLLVEYLPVVIFLVIAAALSVLFIVLSTLFAPKKPDAEKLSAYECGFNAFDDARMEFDVRFYLVSILFIIFDLEVAFLFPWIFQVGAGNVAAFYYDTPPVAAREHRFYWSVHVEQEQGM